MFEKDLKQVLSCDVIVVNKTSRYSSWSMLNASQRSPFSRVQLLNCQNVSTIFVHALVCLCLIREQDLRIMRIIIAPNMKMKKVLYDRVFQ